MLLLLLACKHDKIESTPLDDSDGPIIDTQVIKHSDSPQESQDSDSPTHSDTEKESVDSEDSQPPLPTYRAVDVFPHTLKVGIGATFSLRVIGTEQDSDRVVVTADTFSSDDPAVLTVDASGMITAVGPGTTTIHASIEGIEGTAEYTVRDDGLATLSILHGETGSPLEGVTVTITDALGAVTSATSDATGTLEIISSTHPS